MNDEWVQPTIDGSDEIPLAELTPKDDGQAAIDREKAAIQLDEWASLFEDDGVEFNLSCSTENPETCESCQ